MDFARKILQKYGWKDGDGLGKLKNGMAKPLKATLKFDTAGFGSDQAASDFNNHWWHRVYNEATTNVNVSEECGQIKLALKDDENSTEISTKLYSVQKLKKLKQNCEKGCGKKSGQYSNFLQAATLNNLGSEVENAGKIDTCDIEISKIKVLTDEELFKACGGRTAHKGARHGLKLSGKLSRIERQEAELLSKIEAKRNAFSQDSKIDNKGKIDGQIARQSLENKDNSEENYKVCDKLKQKKRKHCNKESADAITIIQKAAKGKKKIVSNEGTVTIESNEMETLKEETVTKADNDNKKLIKKKKKKEIFNDEESTQIKKKKINTKK